MYELASGIYQSYFAPPKLNILIVGIDGAGKTALLERIKVTSILTKLDNIDDVDNSSNAGAAVAGVGIDTEHDGLTKRHSECNASSSRTTPSMMRGNSSLGGIPARLPPPLPPKQAARGRRRVEEMLLLERREFVCDHDNNDDDTDENMITTKSRTTSVDADDDGYHGDDDKGTRRRSIDHNNDFLTTSKSQNQSLVSLSPGFNSVINILTPAISTPQVVAAVVNVNNNPMTTRRRSSLIGLLSHCPSPMKYQNAALLDDDEYHQQEELRAIDDVNNNGNKKDNDDDVWNNEYLQNYNIEYDDNEEFDVAKQPHKNSSVTRSTPRKNTRNMMPLERIRPTLGQNLSKLDLCGCQCSLFDLSGTSKMRPLWDRYYDDTDAIIYVVDGAETSFMKLQQSRAEFERLCQNDNIYQRSRDLGLPIMIFVNRLDVAYAEYDAGVAYAEYGNASKEIAKFKRRASLEKKVNFVNETHLLPNSLAMKNSNFDEDNDDDDDDCNETMVSKRVVDFDDLAILFGFPRVGQSLGSTIPSPDRGNIFLFGGSAKSGEGVRAAMEYLVAHARTYNSTRTYNSR